MSHDKLFHIGNTHTSFISLTKSTMFVPVISRSKSVEMGVKDIEMSSLYGKVFNKTI